MDRLQNIENTRFLGREFLLWLWFTSEENNGTVNLPTHGEVELFLDDRIILEPVHGDGNRHMLSGSEPATSPEAAIALHINKIPSELKLKLVQQARAWAFTLKGDDLQLRSLRIPEVLSAADDDRLYERLYLLEEIESMLKELFTLFLEQRLDDDWGLRVGSIQNWIHEKNAELSLSA
mgnify:CR=1 FL=1